jgi:hypothetical protein
MIYCEDLLDSKPEYNEYRASFEAIVKKDSPNKRFGFSNDILSMICIDMDAVENALGVDLNKTMDCIVPVGNMHESSKNLVSKRFLLVELKMNSKKHNLGSHDYTDKIRHTRNLLADVPLHEDNIFIFPDSVRSVAYRAINNWSKGSNGNLFKSIRPRSTKFVNAKAAYFGGNFVYL